MLSVGLRYFEYIITVITKSSVHRVPRSAFLTVYLHDFISGIVPRSLRHNQEPDSSPHLNNFRLNLHPGDTLIHEPTHSSLCPVWVMISFLVVILALAPF